MNDKEMLSKRVFAVVGDTVNEQKYAYKIKKALLENGYTVYAVGKESASLNDIPPFDILDLCIHPVKGLKLLSEYKGTIPFVLIQPGASSPEIIAFLDEKKIPYQDGCVLRALEGVGKKVEF